MTEATTPRVSFYTAGNVTRSHSPSVQKYLDKLLKLLLELCREIQSSHIFAVAEQLIR